MKKTHEFVIHLIGGASVSACEEFSGTLGAYLHYRLKEYNETGFLSITTAENGQAYIPVKNILYISCDEPFEQ